MTTIDDLEPNIIFTFFRQLCEIPRGSGNERAVSDWIASFARERGLDVEQDDLFNLLIRKKGTPNLSEAPPVILHGHMDMVCEKVEGSDHDFEKDPIRLVLDGDYIGADGTSLGADNGIGVAYILALLAADDIPHPPLEAVITVMEEKGKIGAAHFDTSRLRGTRMIDFNWITDDQILAGCGGDLTLTIDLARESVQVPPGGSALELAVRGLRGGHCEFDIHLERANGIVVLGRILNTLIRSHAVQVAEIVGGVQNNAIPSEASAVLVMPGEQADSVRAAVSAAEKTMQVEFAIADPALRVDVREVELPTRCESLNVSRGLSQLAILVPHGVRSWSLVTPGIVESSNNLGTVRGEPERFRFMTTITAGVTSRKHFIAEQIKEIARLVGADASEYGLDAPEFPFDPDSVLLTIARETYLDVRGTDPRTLVSNCSLELGMFTQRMPGLDTISVGTEMSGLHSPDERVNHRSVARVWPFVRELVGRLDR